MRALLLSLVLCGVPSLAQGPSPCRKCNDTGLAPCPELTRHACEGSAAQRCSIAASCTACVGTRTVPCAKCERAKKPEAAAALAGREAAQAENRAWLSELEPIDAVLTRKLAHAKSAHFLLTFDVPKLEVTRPGDDVTVTLHAGRHLYLERMEERVARFCADLGCVEGDFLGPTHVLLWAKKPDQEKASLVFTRQSSSTESKLMGKAPVVSIFYDKEWLHEEFELHQAVVHQVTHCLLSNVWDGIWPGNIRGGWIDEGLAHAYEISMFDSVRHYCYVESDTILDLYHGSWEPDVRAAVEKDEAPAFLGVAGKNTTELQPEEQLFAWSYVDFLLRAHRAELGQLARAIKAKQPLQAALAETLKLSPFQFEQEWRAFVKEHYVLKDKKKPGARR